MSVGDAVMDIVGIGTPCMDLLANIPRLPGVNEGMPLKEYSWQGGGKVSTALVAASRLGMKTGMMGVVGDCPYGRFCVADFRHNSVDVKQLVVDNGKETPFSLVLSEMEAHGRNILYHAGTCRRFEPRDLDKDYITGAKCLHLESVTEAAKTAALWIKEAGGLVAFDADGYSPAIEEFLPMIDILIPSEFYYKAVFGDSTDYIANCRTLAARGPQTVVVTLGERGCAGIDRGTEFVAEGFPVPVRDTTGAGDVFHGAFIAGMFKGLAGEACARYANAVSAIKCTRLGGRAGIPTSDVAEEFISSGHIDYTEIDRRVSYYRRWGDIDARESR